MPAPADVAFASSWARDDGWQPLLMRGADWEPHVVMCQVLVVATGAAS